MRKITLIYIGLMYLSINVLFAQKNQNNDLELYYFLRQTKTSYNLGIEATQNTNEGALLSITIPKDKSPSYLVNSAFVIGLLSENQKNGYNAYEAFVQWNRNTLLDKEQNNLAAGFILNFQKIQNENRNFYIPITIIGNYYKDFELNNDAIQFKMAFFPLAVDWIEDVGPLSRKVPEVKNEGGLFKFLYFSWTPYVGVEYDYRFNAEDSNLDGSFLRGLFNMVGSFKFGKDDKFNIHTKYEYRYSFFNTTNFYDRNMHYLDTGLDYSFDNVKGFTPAVGVKYVTGQDPTQGFLDQSYFVLNFTLKK